MDRSDFAERLADKLIEQLKAGTAPWQQPWAAGQILSPYNPTTGNRYRGVNIMALLVTGRGDPRWMTYRQAQGQGWQVRAGEKGTQIQHWIWEEARPRLGKDGTPELDNAGKPIKDTVRLTRPKVVLAAVFNAEQIDGIPDLEPARDIGWDPVEKAEWLEASEAKIQHSQAGGAFYRLSTDTIHLPTRDRFENASAYYATALHELGHWTGHADRLNRDMAHPFGSEGYAREELRAEIASLVLGSEVGLGYDPWQHAGYVDYWVQILTDTPQEILHAASAAEKISEYILALEQKREIQHSSNAEQKSTELRRQSDQIWELVSPRPSPQEVAECVDQVRANGGLFLIVEEQYLDVVRVGGYKQEFTADLQAGRLRMAGYNVANYLLGVAGLKGWSLALVPDILQATKGDAKLKRDFIEGFRSGVGESYDEDEELYPGSEESKKKREERENFCRKFEERLTQELAAVKEQVPDAERIYLAVPYDERHEAKGIGARWDAVKKAWYVGPGVEPEKIAKWEIRHQQAATLDPRAEFTQVLRSLGAVVTGEHPIMNGERQRIRAENDKRGEQTIFYIGHLDGVPNGYAENNRTKEVKRWKARQGLSEEQRSELLAEADKKRYERRQQERERFAATAERLSAELRTFSSGAERTGYHEAKGIEPLAGTPARNGNLLVPGYDVDGKLWTVQYIKEDGTKRFAKDSRKHGCFHVVGAAFAAQGLEKLANSPVIAVAEGYATAVTVAKYGNVPAVAAFDSGNLLAVATALHERWPDKQIMIAGDDDHKLENNPGRMKALEAAQAVGGLVVFPNSTAEQREKGMTDFNDLASENARLAKQQLEEAVWHVRQQGQEQTGEIGKGLLPRGRQAMEGHEVYVPKDAVGRLMEQSMEARIEERV